MALACLQTSRAPAPRLIVRMLPYRRAHYVCGKLCAYRVRDSDSMVLLCGIHVRTAGGQRNAASSVHDSPMDTTARFTVGTRGTRYADAHSGDEVLMTKTGNGREGRRPMAARSCLAMEKGYTWCRSRSIMSVHTVQIFLAQDALDSGSRRPEAGTPVLPVSCGRRRSRVEGSDRGTRSAAGSRRARRTGRDPAQGARRRAKSMTLQGGSTILITTVRLLRKARPESELWRTEDASRSPWRLLSGDDPSGGLLAGLILDADAAF